MRVRSKETERSLTSQLLIFVCTEKRKKQENRQMLVALIDLIHFDIPRSVAPSRTKIGWQVNIIDIVCRTIKLFKFFHFNDYQISLRETNSRWTNDVRSADQKKTSIK